MLRRFRTRRDVDQRFQALQSIAVELIQATAQHDLLTRIVSLAMDLMQCDGGSLYLADGNALVFEVALNRSVEVNFQRRQLPQGGKSVAAYVFRTGEAVREADVYALAKDAPFQFDSSFDEALGYRTRTVLALPLTSSKGKRLGVLQLINRKLRQEERWPSDHPAALKLQPIFSDDDEMLVRSFAALASGSIEKSNLYRDIENLLRGIIRASVDAIESRDPVTSGHSERVALLTVELARTVSSGRDTDLREITFTSKQLEELQIASLLHDFGKISVHERVLLKQKKLFEAELIRIQERLAGFRHRAETDQLWGLLLTLAREGRPPSDLDIARLKRDLEAQGAKFDSLWSTLSHLNEPTVLDESRSQQLAELREMKFVNPQGEEQALLLPDEAQRLAIRRGSLSEEERIAIENHVTSTYRFLKQIPWTEDYRNVPEIAYAHHEKLGGNGYPRKLSAPEISPQARLMTICDIFDALVAADRPYKKAVPIDKALGILEADAKAGAIDPRFVRVFREARLYELPEFLRLNRSKNAA